VLAFFIGLVVCLHAKAHKKKAKEGEAFKANLY
jgi:hypothetical protein